MGGKRILVVDDDAFFRTFCSEVLRGEGHTVHAAGSGAEAMELRLDRRLDVGMAVAVDRGPPRRHPVDELAPVF